MEREAYERDRAEPSVHWSPYIPLKLQPLQQSSPLQQLLLDVRSQWGSLKRPIALELPAAAEPPAECAPEQRLSDARTLAALASGAGTAEEGQGPLLATQTLRCSRAGLLFVFRLI